MTNVSDVDTVSLLILRRGESGVRYPKRAYLIAVFCWVPAIVGCVQEPAGPLLTPVQKMELETLSGQLADPGRSAKTKLDAASLLLVRTYPGAVRALATFLSDSSNASAQIAIAEAITASDGGKEVFIDPLAAMVNSNEPSVRTPAAKALATYRSPKALQKLISVAADPGAKTPVRLSATTALQYAFEKQAVGALVKLLDDPDEAVRRAALGTLWELTNISFGDDPSLWRKWWSDNKNKSWSQWLREWTDSLAKRNRDLLAKSSELRVRLGRAMNDLYAATPAAQRDELLSSFLKDPVSEVRLVGASLVDRRIAASEQISEDVRLRIRSMLTDPDERLRRRSAFLLAQMPDSEVVGLLLESLKTEQAILVRRALLTALGQLGDPQALPAVIAQIGRDEPVAAAAAAALAGIAGKNILPDDMRSEAVDALIEQYRRARDRGDGAVLREALLTAMGDVGGEAFVDALKGGLADQAATVRLAAVKGLAKLGPDSAADWIVPLLGDPDRGVRQAAISAVGDQSGLEHLDSILQRARTEVEPDEAVRQRAWEVAKRLLGRADASALAKLAGELEGRPDALGQRIEILQMLAEAVSNDNGDELIWAKRQLGLALVEADRPAEAATHLSEAYALSIAATKPQAETIWTQWVEALLAADDPAVIKAMAQKGDEKVFAASLKQLQTRLNGLIESQKFPAAILLASEALKQLPQRLSFQQREAIAEVLAQASKKQLAADRQQVRKLVAQLTGADESARAGATEQLQAMAERAVVPLLEELRRAVGGEKVGPETEKAILGVLGQVAPKLTGYDLAAPPAERLQMVDFWIKQS